MIASTTAGGTSYFASGGSVIQFLLPQPNRLSGHYIHPSFAYAQLMILQNVALARASTATRGLWERSRERKSATNWKPSFPIKLEVRGLRVSRMHLAL